MKAEFLTTVEQLPSGDLVITIPAKHVRPPLAPAPPQVQTQAELPLDNSPGPDYSGIHKNSKRLLAAIEESFGKNVRFDPYTKRIQLMAAKCGVMAVDAWFTQMEKRGILRAAYRPGSRRKLFIELV